MVDDFQFSIYFNIYEALLLRKDLYFNLFGNIILYVKITGQKRKIQLIKIGKLKFEVLS